MPTPTGKMGCALQQQLARSWMDETFGLLQIARRQALCTGTGPLDQGQQITPFNNASHQRQTQIDLRCPLMVIWQHPGVALHVGRVLSNLVQLDVPSSVPELLDRLLAELKSSYAWDFLLPVQ